MQQSRRNPARLSIVAIARFSEGALGDRVMAADRGVTLFGASAH